MIKKRKNTTAIIFCIIDILILAVLFVLYGPFSFFRDFWISSAMTTSSHKYLARTLYTEEMIDKVISSNFADPNTGNSDSSQINIGGLTEQQTYSSIYEEAILKKEEGNDLYKVIDISGSNWKGHIVAIYDPTKVKLVQSTKIKTGGQILDKLAESWGAVAAINASGFQRKGNALVPTGSVIMGGKIIYNGGKSDGFTTISGFNNKGILILTTKSAQKAIDEDGIVDAVEFKPFLIVNGIETEFSGNGGWGIAPRTAIGQRKDGIVLFVVIDGRRPKHSIGISIKDLADLMIQYGAYNATNLDGGGSSGLFVNGSMISVAGGYGYTGDRFLPNAWTLINE